MPTATEQQARTLLEMVRIRLDGVPPSPPAPVGAMRRKLASTPTSVASATGIVEACILTTDTIDHDEEVITADAIDQVIVSGRMPALCWFHDQKTIIGRATSLRRQGQRVLMTGQLFLDTTDGREAWTRIAQIRPEWSVGFYPKATEMRTMEGRRVRAITELDLVEVSVVLRGAAVGTGTIGAKRRVGAEEARAAVLAVGLQLQGVRR